MYTLLPVKILISNMLIFETFSNYFLYKFSQSSSLNNLNGKIERVFQSFAELNRICIIIQTVNNNKGQKPLASYDVNTKMCKHQSLIRKKIKLAKLIDLFSILFI